MSPTPSAGTDGAVESAVFDWLADAPAFGELFIARGALGAGRPLRRISR
jgi:hypothetical protein